MLWEVLEAMLSDVLSDLLSYVLELPAVFSGVSFELEYCGHFVKDSVEDSEDSVVVVVLVVEDDSDGVLPFDASLL